MLSIDQVFPGLSSHPGSILLLANHRTGSTALGTVLAQHKKLLHVTEVESNIKVTNYLISGKLLMASVMPTYYADVFVAFNNSAYNIRLLRSNKVDQIASLFVSSTINKFNQLYNEKSIPYTVPIDVDSIDRLMVRLLATDKLAEYVINTYNIKLHAIVEYKDIQHLLASQTQFRKFPKPTNWDEVLEAVERQYKYYLESHP